MEPQIAYIHTCKHVTNNEIERKQYKQYIKVGGLGGTGRVTELRGTGQDNNGFKIICNTKVLIKPIILYN